MSEPSLPDLAWSPFDLDMGVCDRCVEEHPEWAESQPQDPARATWISCYRAAKAYWRPFQVPCIDYSYDDQQYRLCRKHAMELAALVPEGGRDGG